MTLHYKIYKRTSQHFKAINQYILTQRFDADIDSNSTKVSFSNRFKYYGESISEMIDYDFEKADVFVGSGGTMTAESALMGVPTISYNAVPNIVEKYLVRSNLVKRETNPHKIIKQFEKIFETSRTDYKNRAKAKLQSMEDPIQKLISVI